MSAQRLTEFLPRPQRLAVAYAPAETRKFWTITLAFDARMAGIAYRSSEPLTGQLRMAWWREKIAGPSHEPTIGEPLLAAIAEAGVDPEILATLIDGWEQYLVADPANPPAVEALCQARAAAIKALALQLGYEGDLTAIGAAAGQWSLADLGSSCGPEQVSIARELAEGRPWRSVSLPRAMRPLAVLHGLACRAVAREDMAMFSKPADLIAAIRIGLLGR